MVGALGCGGGARVLVTAIALGALAAGASASRGRTAAAPAFREGGGYSGGSLDPDSTSCFAPGLRHFSALSRRAVRSVVAALRPVPHAVPVRGGVQARAGRARGAPGAACVARPAGGARVPTADLGSGLGSCARSSGGVQDQARRLRHDRPRGALACARPVAPARRALALGDRGLGARHRAHRPGTVCRPRPGALRPLDVRSAYDVSPLYRASEGADDGTGQTIALLSIDSFAPAHLDTYSKSARIPDGPTPRLSSSARSPTRRPLKRYGRGDHPQRRARRSDRRLPGRFPDLAEAINRIVAGHVARRSSPGSFGICDGTARDSHADSSGIPAGLCRERTARLPRPSGDLVLLLRAAMPGARTTASSCFDLKDKAPQVHFPSDAPYAVSVGGHGALGRCRTKACIGEPAGRTRPRTRRRGGPLNVYDRRPAWRAAADVRDVSTGGRQVPDVSGRRRAPTSLVVGLSTAAGPKSGWGQD